MQGNDLFIRRMEDLVKRAAKTGCAASRFLSPAEAERAASHFSKRREISLILDGGFDGAERVRAIFLNPEWGEYDRNDLFCALQIGYRQKDSLAHRDILGALMAQGVERDVIGDIIVSDAPPAVLICLPELSGHLMQNLRMAGRVGLDVSKTALDAIVSKQEELRIKTDTVASPRLDAMLCAAFGLSRGTAAELIASGRVSVNHCACLDASKDVCEGALLSIRGTGRAKVVEIGGVSKKGRLFVKTGLFQ